MGRFRDRIERLLKATRPDSEGVLLRVDIRPTDAPPMVVNLWCHNGRAVNVPDDHPIIRRETAS